MVINTIKELEFQTSTGTQVKDGSWQIAKPLASPGWNWKSRVRGAWLLLTGNAFAVRWY